MVAIVLWAAAASQLGYLVGWPMYLYGVAVWGVPAVLVAFLRLGVYSGIGAGLLLRENTAWGAAILEMWRSVFAVLLVYLLRKGAGGPLFPAPWMQGMLSGAMPILVLLTVAVSAQWRPGPELDQHVDSGARILTAGLLLLSFSLRNQSEALDVPQENRTGILLARGLPVLLPVWLMELVAVGMALRHH